MSTPEQRESLFLEILAEMTPEQLAEALKPVDLEAELRLHFEAEPERSRLDFLYGAAFLYRPEFIVSP